MPLCLAWSMLVIRHTHIQNQLQWNLYFTFLQSMFTLILCMFFSAVKMSISTISYFPGIYICVFCPFPLLYVQLTIYWPVIAFYILSVRGQEKELIFSHNFLSLILSLYMLTASDPWHYIVSGSKDTPVQQRHILYWCQACVVMNDF